MLMNSRTIHSEMIKMIHSVSLTSLTRKPNGWMHVIQMTALLEYLDVSHAAIWNTGYTFSLYLASCKGIIL